MKDEQKLNAEDIEATRSLFRLKDGFLADPDRTGFSTTRLEPDDFMAAIFERTVKGLRNVPAFEERMSPEYQMWLSQKKLVEQKTKRLRSEARRKVKKAGGTKLEQQQAAAVVAVPKIDYTGYACWRYNAIVFYRHGKKMLIDRRTGEPVIDEETNEPKMVDDNNHKIVLQEDWLEQDWDWLGEQDFALVSPITYVGRTNTRDNSRFLYALAFDLDGVGMDEIRDLFHQMKKRSVEWEDVPDQVIPTPNIITNSGHGLHLYYILAAPIPLYRDNWEILNRLKTGLTMVIWNKYTSNLRRIDKYTGKEVVDRQFQSIHQAYRIPGSKTKFGDTVTSWRLDDVPLHTITGLSRWLQLNKKFRLTQEEIKSLVKVPEYNPDRTPLAKSAELWPEWYARVITQKQKGKAKWHVKRDLYDWWLRRMRDPIEVSAGHRYWCILTLVTFAVKCDIPEDEVRMDAYALVPSFDDLTVKEDNHFTTDDVDDAMRAYAFSYRNWPIHTIESTTEIPIKRNLRRGRKQNVHLRRIRRDRDEERKEEGLVPWNKTGKNGRRHETLENSKIAEQVKKWMKAHPDSYNKSECARDLELTRPTVRKWWNLIEQEEINKLNSTANDRHEYLYILDDQLDEDIANFVSKDMPDYDYGEI